MTLALHQFLLHQQLFTFNSNPIAPI